MSAIEKTKRVEAEATLRIARTCLEKISQGHSRDAVRDASAALDEMFRVGKKQQLQGLVGHARLN